MEKELTLAEVRAVSTSRGNTRYVARDANGDEYTTFREEIGKRAEALRGRRVRVEYHEEKRGQYRNVYLDGVEAAESDAGEFAGADTDPDEAAWRTAVEAAPWLVGEPRRAVPPEELYDKLKPFEERVAEDIEHGRHDRAAEG